jgi:hypothetical protein
MMIDTNAETRPITDADDKIRDIRLIVWDGAAVASTLTTVGGSLGGRDISGDYRFMDSWQYQNGKWLSVARQQTKVQAD